jgi:hypothetical protein
MPTSNIVARFQDRCCGQGDSKSRHITFVHCTTYHHRNVMLSAAKHLILRPFTSFRVTTISLQLITLFFRRRIITNANI